MTQGVNEKIGAIATVEPERHLVQIGLKMLGADLVPASHDAALQERECGFNRIGCDARSVFVADIFTGQMIDCLMLGIPYGVLVSWEAVSDKYLNVRAHVLADISCQRSALGIVRMEESQVTVSLSKADDNLFRVPSSLRSETFQFAADVGFIHLDSTVKHGLFYFFHGRTDAMAEIPSGLVGTFVLTPKRPLELQGAHALLGFAEQQYSGKPDRQRQVGIVENRASKHGELIDAGLTKEQFFRRSQFDSIGFTAWAAYTFWPAEPLKQFAALFVGREPLSNV